MNCLKIICIMHVVAKYDVQEMENYCIERSDRFILNLRKPFGYLGSACMQSVNYYILHFVRFFILYLWYPNPSQQPLLVDDCPQMTYQKSAVVLEWTVTIKLSIDNQCHDAWYVFVGLLFLYVIGHHTYFTKNHCRSKWGKLSMGFCSLSFLI